MSNYLLLAIRLESQNCEEYLQELGPRAKLFIDFTSPDPFSDENSSILMQLDGDLHLVRKCRVPIKLEQISQEYEHILSIAKNLFPSQKEFSVNMHVVNPSFSRFQALELRTCS